MKSKHLSVDTMKNLKASREILHFIREDFKLELEGDPSRQYLSVGIDKLTESIRLIRSVQRKATREEKNCTWSIFLR